MLILLFQSICNIFLLFEEEVASKNDSFLKTEESLLAWYVLA